ncbi:hypothetical protein BJ138DRAFT_998447 [Hygrophoropsis aurantiaca]|uniref:Uncharacterized protein n=1 Tax=Hygrophoropsis aurantiaca TaxID=72124 RepID=A0ACB8AQJ9_9AGAM|nr:hypothetical protein BJ138DRAFT_998447 [Hygrophoropsis aurantiaca]
MSLQGASFVTVNAFSRELFGGNPAAVVSISPHGELDPTVFEQIAKNFNLPITTFVQPPLPGADDKIFNVRYFTPSCEVVLCGHGLFAATKAIYTGSLPGVNWDSAEGSLRFRTKLGTIVTARMTPRSQDEKDGAWYEIELPQNSVKEVSLEHKERVRNAVAAALGKQPEDLGLDYVASGGEPLATYVIVVLNDKENIDGIEIDASALTEAAPFKTIIMTQQTPGKDHVFISRTFAPLEGVDEDQVCGSAHTLLVPYWSKKLDEVGKELSAKQVSPRGGELKVTWDQEHKTVRLRGQGIVITRGEMVN